MALNFEGINVLDAFVTSVNEANLIPSEEFSTENQVLVKSRGNKLTCNICGVIFDTLESFKIHKQSETHVLKLLNSLSISSQRVDESEEHSDKNLKPGSPYFVIEYCTLRLQCYKLLLIDRKDELYSKIVLNLNLELFRSLITFRKSYISISLNGGGYFASAIFDNMEKRIVCSKTFRRYTSRRKQGGSQSLKDNQGSGSIHSAGASIRRDNEKKLKEDILKLFQSWKSELDMCIIIFCNRDPFLLSDSFDFHNIRTLPFTTYQADYEEICRCYNELVSSIKLLP